MKNFRERARQFLSKNEECADRFVKKIFETAHKN